MDGIPIAGRFERAQKCFVFVFSGYDKTERIKFMIEFAMAASAFMTLTTPVSANTSLTTTDSVRQAVCVKVTIRNPDGSGSSEERCETDSSGRT